MAPETDTPASKPAVALVILDGWGLAPPGPGNCVAAADTPVFDALWERGPRTTLTASGRAVGLPDGQMGNSEVGHLNLGAGRIVDQDLVRIDDAVARGELDTHPVLARAVQRAVEAGRHIHVIGLCSTGGVHSHQSHVVALARAVRRLGAGSGEVIVHAITDGRDVSPTASLQDLQDLDAELGPMGVHVGSVIGRYWAMDRDRRWERTQRAWELLVHGAGAPARSAHLAAVASHESSISDEFIEPHLVVEPEGPMPRIADGDLVIHANFRPDRTRQLCHALVDEDFDGFDRGDGWPRVDLVTMTRYDELLDVPVLFAPHDVTDTLADVLAAAGLGQLHVAETEKYAHVTYFFNGGVEAEHAGEERRLVHSPRDVATYDERPEMSATAAADAFIEGLASPDVAFGIINFANPDMVGHTGSIPAATAAVEHVDAELGRVLEAVRARGGVAIVTADHGNAEQLLDEGGRPHTAHTTNPVPLVVDGLDEPAAAALREGGILADVAPTVLDLLGVAQPPAMTGRTLLDPA